MRDNHEGFFEIVNAYERDGQYFGAVRLDRLGNTATFEFGVSTAGYTALKRILSARPFDSMPGVSYRYFFGGSHTRSKSDPDTYGFAIRVEQGATGKEFQFEGPKTLLANLLWFQRLEALGEAHALKRLDEN
jgi:hypothetical protein